MFEKRSTANLLSDLLERERKAVLSGDLDFLHRMVAEKERLISTVRFDANATDLSKLRDNAARNQRLLEAAALGVRSAAKRLENSRKPTQPMQTYDQFGHRNETFLKPGTFERRA